MIETPPILLFMIVDQREENHKVNYNDTPTYITQVNTYINTDFNGDILSRCIVPRWFEPTYNF